MTALCVGLGWWTHRARQQRRIVERIEASGGYVLHGSLFDPSTGEPREYIVPAWLVESLGTDFFHSVTEVGTEDVSVLPELASLSRLESLVIGGGELNDKSLTSLGELRSLESLLITLGDNLAPLPEVGDETLATVATLPRLESAWVAGTKITPQGIAALARSPSLERVNITCSDPSIDVSAAEPFRQAGRVSYLSIERFTQGGVETVAEWDTVRTRASSP